MKAEFFFDGVVVCCPYCSKFLGSDGEYYAENKIPEHTLSRIYRKISNLEVISRLCVDCILPALSREERKI